MKYEPEVLIEFDTNHLIISLWDDNRDLSASGKVSLRELKFHMDRACASKTWARWEDYGDTK